MSGGSWDYVSDNIECVAHRLCNSDVNTSCYLLRRALGNQLLLIAEALHAIEWVDSCDWGNGDEREALEKCFDEPLKNVEVRMLLEEIERVQREVKKLQ